ncbi:uncharacterized protein [Amphiura filiformis]|uniref:uncharacterized protein isoform X2 n=1 Tax=Amphiura filiformis TaxID=82378 RepID=UPI003B22659C
MDRTRKHLSLRVHQGLQALSALGSSVQSFLGPNQRFKIAIDDDEQDGVIVSSCMELIQALDIQHPVGEIVLSACLAHHKIYGTCLTTLVTMTGYWSLAVQNLLNQGVPISVIKLVGDKCLEHCIKIAASQAILCDVSLSQPTSLSDEKRPHMSSYNDSKNTFELPISESKFDSSVKSDKTGGMSLNSNSQFQSSFTSRLTLNNTKHKPRYDETDYEKDKYDEFDDVLVQDVKVHANEDDSVLSKTSSCCVKAEAVTSTLSSSNNNNSNNTTTTTSAATADDDGNGDDVSWYFEGTGTYDIKDELDGYKTMIEECANASEMIGSLSCADDQNSSEMVQSMDAKHAVQVSLSNLRILNQVSVSESEESNIKLVNSHEGTLTAVMTAGATAAANDDENDKDSDDDDDEFDSCFDDLTRHGNNLSQSKFKMHGNEQDRNVQDLTDSRTSAILCNDDDDDFNDCFTDDLICDKTEPLTSSTSVHEKPDVVTDDTASMPKLHSKCPITKTNSARSHRAIDVSSSKDVTHRLLDFLGHSIGCQEQSVSRKLLNNSRHFRTVESVVEEHHDEDKTCLHGNIDAMKTDDRWQHKLTDGLGHSQGQSASRNLLNSSRHFRTVDSVVEVHQAKDQDVVEWSPSPEDGVNDNKHHETTFKDSAVRDQDSLEEQLQSILHQKLLTKKKSLHSRIIDQSRHFRTIGDTHSEEAEVYADHKVDCPNQELSSELNTGYNKLSPGDEKDCISDIWDLGYGLSHGADREMRLAVQAYLSQSPTKEASGCTDTSSSFDFDRMFVCCITGPSESHSSVVDGLVLSVKEHQIHNIALQVGNSLSCLLINGDLKPSARHTGYKESIKASRIYHGNTITAHQDSEWLHQVMDVLNEISLLITKGQVDENILDMCAAHGIIVLQNVPHKALQGLSNERDIVTYITDANEENKVEDLSVTLWEHGWQHKPLLRKPNMERTHYVVISSKQQLQTAVICSPTITGVMGAETHFWKCLHRLSKAIKDEKVLPGAGATECAFIKCLDSITLGETSLHLQGKQHSSSWPISAFHEYIPPVAMAMKDAFMQYLVKTLQNSTDISVTDLTCLIEDFIKHSDNDNDGILSLMMARANEAEANRLHDSEFSKPSKSCTNNVDEISSNGLDISFNHQAYGRNIHESDKEAIRQGEPSSNSQTVYDSYSAKVASWECAWEIVKTVLQTDSILISGIDKLESIL